ncbi:SCAN domain-containing protein 3 [Octopus bimaculoides]|uniref:SCAN domain-containing protein 3 n=1 Tax=Octopus bimaculoides TaxID=37653 RepID=UPI00071D987D|nr:SCAN domain-containing protein 3 [Octopus bimaculoides]|eukprot:XP_014781353.1 PREDICTED: SCAN domain-containing protein 3-like [Octopus bimaculoides]
MFGFVSVDSKPMCLECDAFMTNHSTKKVKLEQHQKLRHPLSVGNGREYFENKKKIQPIKLPDFVKKINTEKAKTLKPSYLVSEIIAKVAAPQIYGEKLVKPAMIACANEVDDNTIRNQAILLVYVRFVHEDDIKEEMLLIKSLSETTNGEDISNDIMQYFNDKNIPLTSLIDIASDGVAATTGKVKGFVSRMKSVAPYIFYIHCIIHRQHLVAKNIGGHMEEALNTAIHANNFVKSNSVNNRFFMQFCEDEDFKTLLLRTEVRWLSKGLRLERLVNLWEPLINFLMFKKCIAACIAHLEGLHVDFERRYNDLLKMDYPLWFVDLENYELGDENFALAEMLDLKDNMKLRRRVEKEGVFAYISIKESHPNIFRYVEANIIFFPTTWMVESAFSAVVDILNRKRNKLDVNSRGTIRLRLNEFIKIDYDILCQKQQYQASSHYLNGQKMNNFMKNDFDIFVY